MRKVVFFYIITCLSVATPFINGQQVEQMIGQAVKRLDNATSTDEIKQIRNLFERISQSNSVEWSAPYYQAYTDILLAFRSDDKELQKQYLEDAASCLEKLKRIKKLPAGVLSEIATLDGYRYFALMAANPQENGPKYSGVVIASYGEALKLNPENPRAILLNAWFMQNMASFMGGQYQSLQEDIQRATELHQKEDKDTLFPHWLPKGY